MIEPVLPPLLLSLKVSGLGLLCAILPGIAVGRLLARRRMRGEILVRTLVGLPLVLPPVALGFALLLLLSPRSPVGRALDAMGTGPILLTPLAASIVAAIVGFPLIVQGAEQGFRGVPRRLELMARSLGLGRLRTLFLVSLPLAARALVHGCALAFARGLGEFGATVLVAGRIPGETETIAIALYDRIENGADAEAWALCITALLLSLLILCAAEWGLRRRSA